MNTSIVENGGTLVRDEALHRGVAFGREPLLGIIPMSLVLNIVTVVLVALIFWWLLRGSHKRVHEASETPINLLKRRYAAGEIDRKTFLQMKEDITD